jgi:hypothetical protein
MIRATTTERNSHVYHHLLAIYTQWLTDDLQTWRNVKTTGRWHKKTGRTEQSGYQFKKYRTPACKACPVKHLCTSRTGGREIDRSEYAAAVEENNKRYQENHNCIELGRRLTNISLVR